jgi:ABC-2 type transport system permease protein
MSRLLVSTLFRMLKKVVFWFFILCMFSYGVYSASNIASEACEEVVLDGCLFEGLPLMGLVSAIFTSLFIGSEYSDGTIRNKLVVGHSRMRIYLANLIVCSIASILISLAYTAGVFVIGNMKGGEFITETGVITMCMICGLLISVTFTSIMTLLAILNTNKAGNVVISMVLALVLLVSGAFIHQRLNEPKIYDNYVSVNEIGIPTQVEQLPNPQYIDGTPRVILEVLNDLLPSGQAMQLADAFDTDGMTDENIANSPYKWMGYSLLVTFLISILGIILFQKKDIR